MIDVPNEPYHLSCLNLTELLGFRDKVRDAVRSNPDNNELRLLLEKYDAALWACLWIKYGENYPIDEKDMTEVQHKAYAFRRTKK